MIRGIRGAVNADNNTKDSIIESTKKLLQEIVKKNNITTDMIASVIFTATADLNATFPAEAARQIGWLEVPLLCAKEIEVPGSLEKVIRVLIHLNTEKKQNQIEHIYLGETKKLRTDL